VHAQSWLRPNKGSGFKRGIIKKMRLTDHCPPNDSAFDRWRVWSIEGRDVGGRGEEIGGCEIPHIPQGDHLVPHTVDDYMNIELYDWRKEDEPSKSTMQETRG